MDDVGPYLKKHTELLVKDVGVENACHFSGKSKATLGRYYSSYDEHGSRFMPLDVVVALEKHAGFPHVTSALAEIQGVTLDFTHSDKRNADEKGSVNSDVVKLSQRFAMLMTEYHESIADGTISANEARQLLRETQALQEVLVQMKLRLESETS